MFFVHRFQMARNGLYVIIIIYLFSPRDPLTTSSLCAATVTVLVEVAADVAVAGGSLEMRDGDGQRSGV